MKEDEFAIEFCVRFWVCYNIIKMTKQFYNNITPIQPAPVIERFAFTTGQAGLNYERERERVNETRRVFVFLDCSIKAPFFDGAFLSKQIIFQGRNNN